jgi:putative transposase
LAVVLALFNREVAGWSIRPRMTADIVTDALSMAWFRRRPAPSLMHHSDWGSQYARYVFRARPHEYGMVCSISRMGNCRDNVPTENFFNSLKNERVHGTRNDTRDEAMADVFVYIEPFYSRKRQHSERGYVSPVKFLENWVSTQHEQKLAA